MQSLVVISDKISSFERDSVNFIDYICRFTKEPIIARHFYGRDIQDTVRLVRSKTLTIKDLCKTSHSTAFLMIGLSDIKQGFNGKEFFLHYKNLITELGYLGFKNIAITIPIVINEEDEFYGRYNDSLKELRNEITSLRLLLATQKVSYAIQEVQLTYKFPTVFWETDKKGSVITAKKIAKLINDGLLQNDSLLEKEKGVIPKPEGKIPTTIGRPIKKKQLNNPLIKVQT